MKLPFRSRTRDLDLDLDDLDHIDELDNSDDFDDFALEADLAGLRLPEHSGRTAEPPLEDPGDPLDRPDQDRPSRGDGNGAIPAPVNVPADDFSTEMERLRSETSAEQRSAWAYLGVLLGMFGLLVVFGYGCSDVRTDDSAGDDPGAFAATGQPATLVFRVDGDIITLQGVVPDDAARAQIVAAAQLSYGTENVIDELTVDDGVSFTDGTIRMVGSAAFDDARPQALQEMIIADFGLANRGFEVGFVETVLAPVDAVAAIADGRVQLTGALPDQQSIDDLVAVTTEVWGQGNVDGSGLAIGQTTWTEGRIRITGTALSNDQRIGTFVSLIPERIGALVVVDTGELTINDIGQLLNEVQAQINEVVAASPIQFAPLSAEIEPGSDATLVQVAEQVGQVPSTPFEVVGHTDAVGNDQENLVLSQDRAQAVLQRLVELGIPAERITSRGEGETKPIADNDTDEGKAANRRIEFVLVGTSGG